MIKVAIGSTNPVKVEAVKSVFKKAFKKVDFVNLKINSSVSDQPFGDEEIIKGAITRAKKVREKTEADFGVGIEGGVKETEFGLMCSAWCVVVDKKGKLSLGGGMHYHTPKKAAVRIRNGEELGPIMDELTGRHNLKKEGGVVEIITKGLLTRTQAYTQLVKMALSKFIANEWF